MTEPIREVGQLRDTEGRLIVIGADGDAVTVQAGYGLTVRLDATQRDEFIRAYFEAERAAEAWVIEHAANDVVDAEIWCGDNAKCVNGPADHLWQDTCCRDA
jgi:hypothetical protein